MKEDDRIVLCESEEVKRQWHEYCTNLYQKIITSTLNSPKIRNTSVVLRSVIEELKNGKVLVLMKFYLN